MFQIITDIADFPLSWYEAHRDQVSLAPSIVILEHDGHSTEYLDTYNPPETFLKIDEIIRENRSARLTTSMPVVWGNDTPDPGEPASVEYLAHQAIDQGKDVLYLAVNSYISNSYSSVVALFRELDEEFPERSFVAVDTKCASTGLRMLIEDLLSTGPLEEVYEAEKFVKTHSSTIGHLFTWEDLSYIKRSGKIPELRESRSTDALSKTFAYAEFLKQRAKAQVKSTAISLLNQTSLRPFCSCEYDGSGARPLSRLGMLDLSKMPEIFGLFIRNTITDERGIITIAHGNDPEFAEEIKAGIELFNPHAEIHYRPDLRVGMTIQAHGGPTSVHVNYHRRAQGNALAASKQLFSALL